MNLAVEELLLEVWALREAEARRAAMRKLGDALVRARAQYDRVTERNEEVLRGVGEEAVA